MTGSHAPKVLLIVLCVLAASCAVKTTELHLNEFAVANPLSGPDLELDLAALTARINGLWSDLKDEKLTTYLTKKKIAPYFESEKDTTEFIAIYASLMRKNRFAREVVLKYSIEGVKIEPNGVIARVDIKIWGRIYALFYAKIHETQRWEKSGGQWYLRPEAY